MGFQIAQDSVASQGQLNAQRDVRDAYDIVLKILDEVVPDGREKSLAITNLEQSLMWAGKAIFK